MQVVSVDCDTISYDLQPTFSECLEYFEGDPCEDTRQSKKQKVHLHPAVLLGTEECRFHESCYAAAQSALACLLLSQVFKHSHSNDAGLQETCLKGVDL